MLAYLYALEGFLDRLARSQVADRLVLKGGMLLSIWNARRPTRDIDLAGRRIDADADAVRDLVAAVAAKPGDDGLEFDPAGITAGTIRDQDEYAGARVTVPGRLARAVFRFHVDVNVGDPIQPPPVPVDLPRLLGGEPVRLLGYPMAMVLAEKLVTMVERAEANTRWRDFATSIGSWATRASTRPNSVRPLPRSPHSAVSACDCSKGFWRPFRPWPRRGGPRGAASSNSTKSSRSSSRTCSKPSLASPISTYKGDAARHPVRAVEV